MLKRQAFGKWEPDKAASNTALDARNVLAGADHYYPAPSFSAITTALDDDFLGGGAFVGPDGTAALLAGTATDLYRFSGTDWTSVLTQDATYWRLAQFGPLVIAATGGAPAKFDLAGGTGAALGGSPPSCSLVATVRDFVVVAGDASALQTVSWSGFNDAEGWTDGVNQCGSQELPDGGEIMGLAGGEYGLIFQKCAIKRMTYVGSPIVFQIDEIASNVGCMAKGSIAQAGRTVFFLSERGFFYTDGTGITAIGDEKFNRWFFSRFSRQEIETGLSAAIDPRTSIVHWTMPGSPGTILSYNIVLGQATYLQLPVKAVFTGFTANTDLESLSVTYTDLDAMPYSLDDPRFAGGNPLLLVVDPSNVVGTFAGANLAARLATPRGELIAGKRTRLRSLRPVTDAQNCVLSVDSRAQDGDFERITTAGSMRSSGSYPVRCNGRHHSGVVEVPAGAVWSYLSGVDVEFEAEGSR